MFNYLDSLYLYCMDGLEDFFINRKIKNDIFEYKFFIYSMQYFLDVKILFNLELK